jgi:hypothetical protein
MSHVRMMRINFRSSAQGTHGGETERAFSSAEEAPKMRVRNRTWTRLRGKALVTGAPASLIPPIVLDQESNRL